MSDNSIEQSNETSKSNELDVSTLNGQVNFVGYDAPLEITVEQWVEDGKKLGKLSEVTQWAIGDWVSVGQKAFDEDVYEQHAAATGLARKTIENYASISRNLPKSRRREGVSFSIHAEVASLEPTIAERFLKQAAGEDEGEPEAITVQAIRDWKREQKGGTGNGGEITNGDEKVTIAKTEHDRLIAIVRAVKAFFDEASDENMQELTRLVDEQEAIFGRQS